MKSQHNLNLEMNSSLALFSPIAQIKETYILPFWHMVEELIEYIFGGEE